MSRTLTVLSAAKSADSNGVNMVIKRSWKTGTDTFGCEPIQRCVDALIVVLIGEELDEVIFTPRAVRNLNDLLVYAKFEVIK